MKFVFFGTDKFSVIILNELKKAGFVPALVVTATDKPKGRGLKLTPPPVKTWVTKHAAQNKKIELLQPEKLDDEFFYKLKTNNYQLFIVASYGKIIPKRILDIPVHGALNVHPSLLPLYRGPSPIEQQILDGAEDIGVTIMEMDEQMDHGPILATRELGQQPTNNSQQITSVPRVFHSATFTELHDALAHLGGELLAETIPQLLAGEIKPREQNHAKATYTKKIVKKDGLVDLNDDAEKNYRKFLAYTPWPGIYFFETLNNDLLPALKCGVSFVVAFHARPADIASRVRVRFHSTPHSCAYSCSGDGAFVRGFLVSKKFRIKITDAEFADGAFVIKKVIPEGKKETSYKLFRSSARQ